MNIKKLNEELDKMLEAEKRGSNDIDFENLPTAFSIKCGNEYIDELDSYVTYVALQGSMGTIQFNKPIFSPGNTRADLVQAKEQTKEFASKIEEEILAAADVFDKQIAKIINKYGFSK